MFPGPEINPASRQKKTVDKLKKRTSDIVIIFAGAGQLGLGRLVTVFIPIEVC